MKLFHRKEKPKEVRIANFQLQGQRERQEDSFALVNATDVTRMIREGLFAIVADGMGGLQDGKEVSEAAVAEFVSFFHEMDSNASIPEQFARKTQEINRRVQEHFQGAAGTTVVAATIFKSCLYWLSIGDSYLYLYRDGELTMLNQEHNYRNQLFQAEIRKKIVNREIVLADEDGARLSSFLGMDGMERVDYNKRPLKLKKGDTLFLCCDGVVNALGERAIRDCLMEDAVQAALTMETEIMKIQDPSLDNCTGIIINCCE